MEKLLDKKTSMSSITGCNSTRERHPAGIAELDEDRRSTIQHQRTSRKAEPHITSQYEKPGLDWRNLLAQTTGAKSLKWWLARKSTVGVYK